MKQQSMFNTGNIISKKKVKVNTDYGEKELLKKCSVITSGDELNPELSARTSVFHARHRHAYFENCSWPG